MSTDRATTLGTIERGLQVFEYICAEGPAAAKHIAHALGIRTGTCYHVLRTLVSTGHITRLPSGEYEPGPQAFRVARDIQQRVNVKPELNVILSRLHRLTGGETSYISRWQDGVVILQHYLAGTRSTNVGRLEVGYAGDLHARASGKAIAALLPPEQAEALFMGVPLEALTAATITDYNRLLVELEQIRRLGYALDREEFTAGVHCVAAAFTDSDGVPLGAFTVSVPTIRFTELRVELIAAVTDAARLATRQLAGRPTPG